LKYAAALLGRVDGCHWQQPRLTTAKLGQPLGEKKKEKKKRRKKEKKKNEIAVQGCRG
jgi:hypothetical protein